MGYKLISVVLATYNGEKYILPQIKSIAEQDEDIQEVIICDDGSSDDTVSIIKTFIREHELDDKWKLIENAFNLGYTKNFIRGMMSANGDVIVLCDQDDIWEKNRICSIKKIFEENSDALCITCLQRFIDENDNKHIPLIGGENILTVCKILRNTMFSDIEKIGLARQVRENRSTGMTMAIKKSIVTACVPYIYKYNLTHDLILGLYAAVYGGHYRINKALVNRRIHKNNTSMPMNGLNDRVRGFKRHIGGRYGRLKLLYAIREVLNNTNQCEYVNKIDRTINDMRVSLYALYNENICLLFKQLFTRNTMINYKISVANLVIVLIRKGMKCCERFGRQ